MGNVRDIVHPFVVEDRQHDAEHDRGDRAGARQELEERATVLAKASDSLKEPMLADDGARLVRLANAVGGEGSIHDPLPLVVMLRGTGYGYL